MELSRTASLLCMSASLAVAPPGCDQNAGVAKPSETVPRETGAEEKPMETMDLPSLIRAGYDDRAIDAANAKGPTAFGEAEPLLADPAAETRAIALRVLHAVDPGRAQPHAVSALADRSDDVKTSAVAVLEKNPPSGAMGEMLTAFRTANDPAVRGDIALLAGRVAPPEQIDAWVIEWRNEDDPYAKSDIRKALARMGDKDARESYRTDMRHAEAGRPAYDAIDGTAYFEDTWIVPDLAAMLDRQEIAIHLAPDEDDTLPLRICDIAAEAILGLTKEPVEFKTPRSTPYKPDEMNQVRAIAKKYTN